MSSSSDPGRRHTREQSGLVLDEEGRWFHDGAPVEHPKVAQAFHRGLERAPDGRFVVRVGPDWCFVEVRGMPLQVLSALVDRAAGAVELTYSNGLIEPLRPRSLCASEGILYCVASTGLSARFSRSAQVAVGALIEESPGGFVLDLGQERYPIGQGTPEPAVAPAQKGA
jgi:hypothetical protein